MKVDFIAIKRGEEPKVIQVATNIDNEATRLREIRALELVKAELGINKLQIIAFDQYAGELPKDIDIVPFINGHFVEL